MLTRSSYELSVVHLIFYYRQQQAMNRLKPRGYQYQNFKNVVQSSIIGMLFKVKVKSQYIS